MRSLAAALLALGLAAAAPGYGEVVESSATGFSTSASAIVAASPDVAWDELVHPARYWNGEHSWSGDAANLTMNPVAGGCFCEALPAHDGHPAGSAEHMRVVQAMPGRLLRMRGALGPLQGEALAGTLSVTLEPVAGGTKLTWEYVVGGHARFDLAGVAPAVDRVVGEQLERLAARLGESGEGNEAN